MSGPYRSLRPAPLADGQQPPPPPITSSASKSRASLACQPCREKRRKCSGERPECRECCRRLVKCVYEAAPGQTRMASLRDSNERMKTDLDTVMELYWYLQTQPKDKVGEALSAIQTGASPSQVMEAIKLGSSSSDTTPSSDSSLDPNGQTEPRPSLPKGPSRSNEHPSQSESSASSHGAEISLERAVAQLPSSGRLIKMSRSIDCLERGADAFFSCTGCIFHIYDPDETQKMLENIRPYLENAQTSWLEFIFQGLMPAHLKPALCSLCIMAAVGLQYTKNPIPALGFESSGSDGSYEYVSIFYESARHLLEAVIKVNILEAMKVCAALCVFNTIGHATVAMAYADMGINFVLSLGPSLQYRPASLDEESWIKHKRVARTLVTLRSWLVSTLGYVHGEHAALQTGINWLIDNKGMTPNETIQHELNKVVQIEANLLRTIDSFRNISPVLLSSTRKDLAQWYEHLPDWMHLTALVERSGLTLTRRRTVFLVHLFYLSASILLARLAHSGQKSPDSETHGVAPRYDSEDVRIAAIDGLQAARTAARILQLQMDEQSIFQRCWNCEFSAYISCLTLLHSVVHMQLHKYPQATWQEELSHARSCLDVLEYCAKADKVADRFAQVTRGYYAILAAELQPSASSSRIDPDADADTSSNDKSFDYLFSVPEKSPAHLAQVSSDLLKRLGCPFDSPSNLHDEGTLKAGFGAHVNLPFNRGPSKGSNTWSAVEMALSGMPSGQFVGSVQPHGWDIFLNFNSL